VKLWLGRDFWRSCVLRKLSFLSAELNGSPVVSAGKETSHKPEVVMKLGRERSGGQDADNVCGSEPAICNITKDKQLNSQTFTQISQRTSLLGNPLRL